MDVRRTCAAVLAVFAASSAGCGSQGTSTAPDRARTAIALAELRGHVVFSRFDDIWTANADGSAPRRLTTRRGAEFDRAGLRAASRSPTATRVAASTTTTRYT